MFHNCDKLPIYVPEQTECLSDGKNIEKLMPFENSFSDNCYRIK